jgi:hypothetical protein
VFADEPSLFSGQMLLTFVPDPLRWSVGDPHAHCGKPRLATGQIIRTSAG